VFDYIWFIFIAFLVDEKEQVELSDVACSGHCFFGM